MIIDRSVKIGVISSIIATIIFIYLLNPILKLFSYILFTYGSSLFRVYIDRLFKESALLTPPDPGLDLIIFVILFCNAVSISAVMVIFYRVQETKNKNLKSTNSNNLLNNINLELSQKITNLKKHRSILIVLSIFIAFLSTMLLHTFLFQHRLITSFNQHVIAIAPYVDDQKIKLLKSKWTQIKSENDYRTIYYEMEVIAEKNKITLPENFMYPSY